jgi:hypothetical protein
MYLSWCGVVGQTFWDIPIVDFKIGSKRLVYKLEYGQGELITPNLVWWRISQYKQEEEPRSYVPRDVEDIE